MGKEESHMNVSIGMSYNDLPSRNRVAALSALFGWEVPPEGELAAASSHVAVA